MCLYKRFKFLYAARETPGRVVNGLVTFSRLRISCAGFCWIFLTDPVLQSGCARHFVSCLLHRSEFVPLQFFGGDHDACISGHEIGCHLDLCGFLNIVRDPLFQICWCSVSSVIRNQNRFLITGACVIHFAELPSVVAPEDFLRARRTLQRRLAYIVSERAYRAGNLARQRIDRQADIVVGVETDTTMHDQLADGIPTAPETERAPSFRGQFTPAELDIDDLAEAIRLLLGPGQVPQNQADCDLPSLLKRASHVVGRTRKH